MCQVPKTSTQTISNSTESRPKTSRKRSFEKVDKEIIPAQPKSKKRRPANKKKVEIPEEPKEQVEPQVEEPVVEKSNEVLDNEDDEWEQAEDQVEDFMRFGLTKEQEEEDCVDEDFADWIYDAFFE